MNQQGMSDNKSRRTKNSQTREGERELPYSYTIKGRLDSKPRGARSSLRIQSGFKTITGHGWFNPRLTYHTGREEGKVSVGMTLQGSPHPLVKASSV